MPLNSSAPRGVAMPSRPARPGLILAILATASFIAVLDLHIERPKQSGAALHAVNSHRREVADHILGFLNS
ncbi:hypothetical protein [Streptomyces sp. WAC00263]|uniref:hypothetical protein n=1 Tax=Streptomyces sp. WAC00263 TaxID=1917422 RepID=UPI0009CA2254|nr:hypothetical protein [Streptomyces sp. WAC00263]KAF5998899.1 hypothetical protein BOG92_051120 [Streptomyces sp. WAC00263]